MARVTRATLGPVAPRAKPWSVAAPSAVPAGGLGSANHTMIPPVAPGTAPTVRSTRTGWGTFVPKQLFGVAVGGGSNLRAACQVLPADVVK